MGVGGCVGCWRRGAREEWCVGVGWRGLGALRATLRQAEAEARRPRTARAGPPTTRADSAEPRRSKSKALRGCMAAQGQQRDVRGGERAREGGKEERREGKEGRRGNGGRKRRREAPDSACEHLQREASGTEPEQSGWRRARVWMRAGRGRAATGRGGRTGERQTTRHSVMMRGKRGQGNEAEGSEGML